MKTTRAIVPAILLLLLAGGCGKDAGPTLAEALGGRKANRLLADDGKEGEAFRFAFYSDPQGSRGIQEVIAKRILEHEPLFTVMGGDAVNECEYGDEWVDYLRESAPLRERMPYLPVYGNHDVGTLYDKVFAWPEPGKYYYSVDFRQLHLVILDTEGPNDPGSAQGRWLEEDLKKAVDAPFTVVFHHKPVYSSGRYYHESDRAPLRNFNPLFLEYGVDLSFCGHEHFYERLEADGLVYVVADGSGAHLRDPVEVHPNSRVFLKQNHYCIVTAGDERLEVEVFGLDGKTLDRFTVKPR